MSRKFVVMLESATKEQNDQFLKWIESKELAWWHWLSNAWLIHNRTDNVTSEEISTEANKIFGGLNFVSQVRPEGTWYGWGPSSSDRNMFEWIRNTWSQS